MTNDTKLAELLPMEYEVDNERVSTLDDRVLTIPVKKRKPKDFDWYVNCYLKSEDYLRVKSYLKIESDLFHRRFELIPFEVKLGILKIINDDLCKEWNYEPNFPWVLNALFSKTSEPCKDIRLIRGICPSDFLESIF